MRVICLNVVPKRLLLFLCDSKSIFVASSHRRSFCFVPVNFLARNF